MAFISVYQRECILIKSLELKLSVYKLTLDLVERDKIEEVGHLREVVCLLCLYVQIGLKSDIEEDFFCYLNDISLCCDSLEQYVIGCGNLGVLEPLDLRALLEKKEVIYNVVTGLLERRGNSIGSNEHSFLS